MATFGKVLLFLNLMLAVVVFTIFGLSLGQEKRWATAAYVSELPIIGLPVDTDELDPDDPSAKRVDKLTKPVMAAYWEFPHQNEFGTTQVKTVLEELQRVQGVATGRVSSAANDEEKRKELYRMLVPQAKTIAEREELIRRINDPKVSIAELVSELERRFSEAKNGTGKGARQEQRLNIATLLFCLHADALWRQRVMRIVGMETYIHAVERQALYSYAMALEYQALIVQDRTAFEKSYADLVESILKNSEELHYLDKFLRDLNTTLAERNAQIRERETEVENAKTALATATKNTQVEVNKLNAIQYDLFQLQQRVGLAIQKNQELEQDLRKLEQKKPGL